MKVFKPNPNAGDRLFFVYIVWYLVGSLSVFILAGVLEWILAR